MNIQDNPIIRFLIRNFVDGVYCIGYRFNDTDFWEENVSKFKVFKPTLKYWYADPIPFVYNNKYYVFMERFNRFKRIGDIVVSALNNKNKLSVPRAVITKDTHLSYPMVISYKGNYYMLPETSATKSIDIYIMKDSPYQWEEYYSIRLNEEIVDVSYVIDDHGILLLAGVLDSENPIFVKRQIIKINDLDNVQKLNYKISYTDKEGALNKRNGGAFLKKGKGLYRVVQESTIEMYGLAITLNKVHELSDENIDEECIIRKDVKNIDIDLKKLFYKKTGVHTYGACIGGFEVIDMSVAKLSLVPLINHLMYRG